MNLNEEVTKMGGETYNIDNAHRPSVTDLNCDVERLMHRI